MNAVCVMLRRVLVTARRDTIQKHKILQLVVLGADRQQFNLAVLVAPKIEPSPSGGYDLEDRPPAFARKKFGLDDHRHPPGSKKGLGCIRAQYASEAYRQSYKR